jgi:hypothetical protein
MHTNACVEYNYAYMCVEGGFQSPDITSHKRPALVPNIMAGLEGWPVL